MGNIYNHIQKIEIDKKSFRNLTNLKLKVYSPVNRFMDKENFMSVINYLKLKDGKFSISYLFNSK